MIKKTASVLVVLMLLFTSAYAQEKTDQTTQGAKTQITVNGSASVHLEADYAIVELGVSYTGKTMTVSQEENAKKMNAVIEQLETLGVTKDDVHTSNFYAAPKYDYDYGKLSEKEAVVGYVVENTLSVTIRDIENISKILDASISAGANTTYGLTFYSDNSQDAYLEALTKAVQNGLQKAVVLSESIGDHLGTVVSISENGSYSAGKSYELTYSAPLADAGIATPVIANDIVVNANVTIVYELIK